MLNVHSVFSISSFKLNLLTKLSQCKSMSDLKRIQALLITLGTSQDDRYVSRVLSFSALSPSGNIDYAYRVLSSLSNPRNFDWNYVIRGYSSSGNPAKCISVFVEMLRFGVSADHMTYPFLVKASSRLLSREVGGSVHGRIVKCGYESDLFICNSLIHMYGSFRDIVYARNLFDEMTVKNSVSWNSMLDAHAKCGDVVSARQVFDKMPERDVVSWSSLIDGYVKSEEYKEAIEIFKEMMKIGPKANEVTMVSLLCACAHLGALDWGRMLHRCITDEKLPLTLKLRTSLIDMYAKCGAIEEAWPVFRGVSVFHTDVLIWNTMIGGLATHGFVRESLELFHEMLEAKIKPDEITYLCLLNACSHGGLVKEAWFFFERLCKSGMNPTYEHYACLVDVLSRAGKMSEAYDFISQMPIKPTASMLGALLNGCINHGKLDLAEVVGRKLIELQPDHDGRYVGLANVYATIKRWDDARSMREAMEKRGVKKFPGVSVLELSGILHRFIAHDKSHGNSELIYTMLDLVVTQIKLDVDKDKQDFCSLYNLEII